MKTSGSPLVGSPRMDGSPRLWRVETCPVDDRRCFNRPTHRPILEFIHCAIDVPNAIIEICVSASSDEGHEAVKLTIFLFARLPIPNRVLVRCRFAIGLGLLPASVLDELTGPHPVVSFRPLTSLRQIQFAFVQQVTVHTAANDAGGSQC